MRRLTPGQRADHALTLVNQASGSLGYMVVKRKLQRWRLAVVIGKLKDALRELESINQEETSDGVQDRGLLSR